MNSKINVFISILLLLAIFTTSCGTIRYAWAEMYFYRKNLRKHPVASFDFRSGFLNDTVSFYLNNDTIFEKQILTSYYELNSCTHYNFIITKKKGVCYIDKSWGKINFNTKIVDVPSKQLVVILIVNSELHELPIDLKKGRHVYFNIEKNRLNMWQRIVPGNID
jgi:hypothetical protein